MNWEGTEPLLDQLAAIIGIFMLLVAAYVLVKLLTQPQHMRRSKLVVEGAAGENSMEKVPLIPKAQKQAQPLVTSSFGFSTQYSPSEPIPTPPSSSPTPLLKTPPQLAFGKVSKSGDNLIRLTLTNVGSDLKFEQVRPAKFNEIDVKFQPKAMMTGAYRNKSSMNFLLKGRDLDFNTYHFKVFYKDLKGRRYVQEIAGLGDEVPIVEAPVVTE